MTAVADLPFLGGKASVCTIVGWRSQKLRRVARSSSASEVQAANNAQEELEYTRLVYCEMTHDDMDLHNSWAAVKAIPGVLVVDAKDVWDACSRNESSALGMIDRRSAIEALALRQALSWSRTPLRWVHSNAMVADVLTKGNPAVFERALRFATSGRWRLIDDPSFTSAKKRAKQGLDDLDEIKPNGKRSAVHLALQGLAIMTLKGLAGMGRSFTTH